MRFGLVYDIESAKKNHDYIRYHHEVGKRYDIDVELIMRDDIWDDVNERLICDKVLDKGYDIIMVRSICPKLSKSLEDVGIRIFNPYQVSYIANHKGRCIEYVSKHTDVECIPTVTYGYDKMSENFVSDHMGDVIKTVGGHGGVGVYRLGKDLKDVKHISDEAKKILKGSEFICQPFIAGPFEDVRVYVVGDEIVSLIKRKSITDDFRANYSLGSYVSRCEFTDELREYVRQICEIFRFGMVGIDFIKDDKGRYIFNEIEDVVGARMLYKVSPDTDILDRYFSFLLNNL